jgi:hypothetical protein
MSYWVRFLGLPNDVEAATAARLARQKVLRYTVAQVPFWIWDDVRVTVETVSARLEITRPDEIALYATVFDELRQSAVYGSRARELISEAVADHLQHAHATPGGPGRWIVGHNHFHLRQGSSSASNPAMAKPEHLEMG